MEDLLPNLDPSLSSNPFKHFIAISFKHFIAISFPPNCFNGNGPYNAQDKIKITFLF